MSNGWQTQKENQAWRGRMRRVKEFHYQNCASGEKKLRVPDNLQIGDKVLPDGTVKKAASAECQKK